MCGGTLLRMTLPRCCKAFGAYIHWPLEVPASMCACNAHGLRDEHACVAGQPWTLPRYAMHIVSLNLRMRSSRHCAVPSMRIVPNPTKHEVKGCWHDAGHSNEAFEISA